MRLIAEGSERRARRRDGVFRRIALRLDDGEALMVTGPNGSGKSTLLRIVAGLLPRGSGQRAHSKAAAKRWPDALPRPATISAI